MRTRHPGGARFSACPHRPPVPVFFQVGRRLWGRASSLPVRVVEAGRAFPRECGVLGLVGSRVPDTLIPGLLGRRDAVASRRPSVAPSARSRVGERGGLRPRRWRAGGLPRSRESGPRRASRGSPVGICAGRAAPPRGRSGTNADPAPRWGAVFRVSPSAPVPVFFQVGRRLWGRASSLPVRVVEAGRAFPRECGVLGLVGSRVPDTLIPGLLGRRDAVASRRPSVAPSAWSRVGERGGLRPRRWHAGGLPRSRESGPRRASRGSPVGICAGRAAPPRGRPGTNADPAPRWGAVFRVSPSAPVPVFFQVGRRLWGRASSLPVRVVEAGRAFPRECGVLGLVGSRVPDTLIPGLLGRRDAVASRRPSVAPSAWSRVGERGGLRPRRWHAGGLPRSRESGPRRASRGSPVGICAGRAAPARGRSGTNADPAPRWGAVFRVSPSASVPVFFQVGRRLWGRASSLPVRVVEAGRAFPRECGVLGLVGSRVPDTLIPGLLGRRDALASRRPSVAPSAWSRVG